MRPNDLSALVLCEWRYADLVEQTCPVSGRRTHGGVVWFDGHTDVEQLKARSMTQVRLLDKYHIVYDPMRPSDRDRPELALFQCIAYSYDKEIEWHRNASVIRELVRRVMPAAPRARILDYGCGTGLSKIALAEHHIHLIGFDRSRAMRQVAASRGVTVVDSDGLNQIEDGSLDGVFASYVMHLHSAFEDLGSAVNKIRLGGAFAANFHKGLGWSETNAILEQRGFSRRADDANSNELGVNVWIRTSG